MKGDQFQKLLEGVPSAYLDTSNFIYHLQDDRPYAELTSLIFGELEAGCLAGHTSTLTLLEVNVRPYQVKQADRALSQLALLKNFPHLTIHDLTPSIADRAAELRGKHGIRTPDAIHLATSLETGCDLFIGNDKRLKKIADCRIVVFDDFL